MRFQSRVETHGEVSPGPQTYIVSVPSNPTLGLMTREPKFRDHKESYVSFVGPGSYDVKSTLGHSRAYDFGKGFNKDESARDQGTEESPGPGHYARASLDGTVGYSMARSTPPIYSESERLGPGYYRLPDPYRGGGKSGRFASSPRFHESPQQKIESEG